MLTQIKPGAHSSNPDGVELNNSFQSELPNSIYPHLFLFLKAIKFRILELENLDAWITGPQ